MIIVTEPDREVTYVVPTTRQAAVEEYDEGLGVLTVYDSTRHEVYSGEIGYSAAKPYKLTFDVTFGLPDGQYTYTMADGSGIIGGGVMQVGLTPAEVKQYQHNETIVVYER